MSHFPGFLFTLSVPSQEHIASLHGIIGSCLESRPTRRSEVEELIPQFEEMRREILAAAQVTRAEEPATPRPPPEQFVCPLTLELMEDPVFTADGQVYERAPIERWLRLKNSSPLTGARLAHKELVPAISLRQLIQEFKAATLGQ